MSLKIQEIVPLLLNLKLGLEAKKLQLIDEDLVNLISRYEMFGKSKYYIWHTSLDSSVRSSHAKNEGEVFAWNSPPPTGHPGRDYNCRCWAEPIGSDRYADQFLITQVSNYPKWRNIDFVKHYVNKNGGEISLDETGYLQEIIEHYGYVLNKYHHVNKQIIEVAKKSKKSKIKYEFKNTYDFGGFLNALLPFMFSGVLFSFGDATVKGLFEGKLRKEQDYLVINGIISYEFHDIFKDPLSQIEILMILKRISRAEAEKLLGGSEDKIGTPFKIKGSWQTKFNATIKLVE